MKLAVLTLSIALVSVWSETPAQAKPPTGVELAKRWNRAYYYAGKTAKSRVDMTIESKGRRRSRRFVILRRDKSDLGDQKYFVFFQRPSDVRRTTLLVWKSAKGTDDRWLYLPDLDLVRRVEGKQGRTSFAGSDFVYEDMSGRSVSDDNHKLEKTTSRFYVLLSTPKKRSQVDFDAFRVYIDRKTFLPHKAVYYRAGKKTRAIESLAFGNIGGHPVVTRARATDYRTKSSTTIALSRVQFDINLPASLFEEGSLRAAPSVAKR